MSEENFKAKIYKRVSEIDTSTWKTVKEKELSVSGESIKEIKKIFDEEWENDKT